MLREKLNQSSIAVEDCELNMTLYYDKKDIHKLNAVNYVRKAKHSTTLGFMAFGKDLGEKVQILCTYPNGTRLQRVKCF